MTINDTGLTCPACLAAPGTPHSLACDDPEEFRRREFERLSAEYEAAQIAAQEAEERAAEARKALAAAAKRAMSPMAAAKAEAVALVRGGMSEAQAARTVGIDRMTLRKALGKR